MNRFCAVILDFDGLILETEAAAWASWREIFRSHGSDYTLEDFQRGIGSAQTAHSLFESRCGHPDDWSQLDRRRREIEARLVADLSVQPGIPSLLEQSRALGLGLAVASSSRHAWVDSLLSDHGLLDRFDAVVCREDAARAKPEPDLYQEALRRLRVEPPLAVAFEDSYNGVLAARLAGIRCVAVPTHMTATQSFSHADVVVGTLAGLDLRSLLHRLAAPESGPVGPK
jgi:putative hydrolase of the HAD superfamily